MAPGDCCMPPPPANYEGKGTENSWGGLAVYASGSPTSPSAVVFICDIYGWKVPQARYLADKIASHGHYVLVPDFLNNDFYSDSADPNNPYKELPEFLARHPQPEAIDRASLLIEKLRDQHKETLKKVGVMGNCWGAKIAISLLFGDKQVDVAVMNHPSFLTHDEVKAVVVPLAILGAEIDFITPPKMALEFAEILKNSPKIGDKSSVKIFEGVEHGWTTRYDLEDEGAHQKAEEAHTDIIAWFAKFLGDAN